MRVEVSYTNGQRGDQFDSLEEAEAAIRIRWPEAVIGHNGDLNGFGDRTLFWECTEDSEDDDGARALGSIRFAARRESE